MQAAVAPHQCACDIIIWPAVAGRGGQRCASRIDSSNEPKMKREPLEACMHARTSDRGIQSEAQDVGRDGSVRGKCAMLVSSDQSSLGCCCICMHAAA